VVKLLCLQGGGRVRTSVAIPFLSNYQIVYNQRIRQCEKIEADIFNKGVCEAGAIINCPTLPQILHAARTEIVGQPIRHHLQGDVEGLSEWDDADVDEEGGIFILSRNNSDVKKPRKKVNPPIVPKPSRVHLPTQTPNLLQHNTFLPRPPPYNLLGGIVLWTNAQTYLGTILSTKHQKALVQTLKPEHNTPLAGQRTLVHTCQVGASLWLPLDSLKWIAHAPSNKSKQNLKTTIHCAITKGETREIRRHERLLQGQPERGKDIPQVALPYSHLSRGGMTSL